MEDTRTAWAQEADAKREAWNEIDRLKKRIAELEKINANQCKLLEFYANDYQSRKG